MESFLKKIAEKKFDEDVHSEFIKFSKGVFDNRYLIEAKKQKDKFSIKTSAEFANYFVRSCLEKVNGEIEVKGVIISTFDISKEVNFEISNVKKYMGIQQLIINTKTTADKILKVMEKYPRSFYGLSFITNDSELKIKEKAPKSGKPSAKGERGPKADFCSLKTTNKKIIDNLLFDIPEFKEVSVNHTIKINDIEIPNGVNDPQKIREMAKRKGTIVRKINVDGKDIVKEYNFEA